MINWPREVGGRQTVGFYAYVALRFTLQSKEFTRIQNADIIAMVQRSCARLGIKKTIPVYMNTYFSSPL
jgi:bla regulator protein BlaR1